MGSSELASRHLSQLRCRLSERSWQASRRCCQPAVHDTARSHTLACTYRVAASFIKTSHIYHSESLIC